MRKITAVTSASTMMPWQVLVDVGGVDDVADEIGAERGRRGRHAHQRERDRIAPPLPEAPVRSSSRWISAGAPSRSASNDLNFDPSIRDSGRPNGMT